MNGPLYFLSEVDTPDKQETLRQIRNECRTFMTNNTEEISPQQQQEWFAHLDRTEIIPYLFVEGFEGVCFLPIGYGLLRFRDNETLLTGGLKADQRDKGLGTELFLCLIDKAKELSTKPIHLEVQRKNVRAYRLYRRLGFEPLYTTYDKVYMELVE